LKPQKNRCPDQRHHVLSVTQMLHWTAMCTAWWTEEQLWWVYAFRWHRGTVGMEVLAASRAFHY